MKYIFRFDLTRCALGIILVVMNKDINKEIVEDSVVITEGPWADKTITISAEIIMEEE